MADALAVRESLPQLTWTDQGFIDWVGVKSLADACRIRILRRGLRPYEAEACKAIAVALHVDPDALVLLHRDGESVRSDINAMRSACQRANAALAAPMPCSEAWLLRAAGHRPPKRAAACKREARRLDDSNPLAAGLDAILQCKDGKAFSEDLRKAL